MRVLRRFRRRTAANRSEACIVFARPARSKRPVPLPARKPRGASTSRRSMSLVVSVSQTRRQAPTSERRPCDLSRFHLLLRAFCAGLLRRVQAASVRGGFCASIPASRRRRRRVSCPIPPIPPAPRRRHPTKRTRIPRRPTGSAWWDVAGPGAPPRRGSGPGRGRGCPRDSRSTAPACALAQGCGCRTRTDPMVTWRSRGPGPGPGGTATIGGRAR